MVESVVTVEADGTLKDAAELFTRYGFRAIPVVDADQKILGVLTYRDVMELEHRFVE
jgi:CBS domain-containing protein